MVVGLIPSRIFGTDLLSLCRSTSYSRDESCRARDLLVSVSHLQPLIFGLAEELLSISLEPRASALLQVLDGLSQQVRNQQNLRRRQSFTHTILCLLPIRLIGLFTL